MLMMEQEWLIRKQRSPGHDCSPHASPQPPVPNTVCCNISIANTQVREDTVTATEVDIRGVEHRPDRELKIEQVTTETTAAEMPITSKGIETDDNSAKKRVEQGLWEELKAEKAGRGIEERPQRMQIGDEPRADGQ